MILIIPNPKYHTQFTDHYMLAASYLKEGKSTDQFYTVTNKDFKLQPKTRD